MAENISKFIQDLQGNEELGIKFEEELKRIAEAKEVQSDLEAVMKAAKALGYDISIADIEKSMADCAELDQDELESVSGGKATNWCAVDWACYYVLKHDTEKDNKEDACIKDYNCGAIYHDGIMSCKRIGYKGYEDR